jgi:hypothetical protein
MYKIQELHFYELCWSHHITYRYAFLLFYCIHIYERIEHIEIVRMTSAKNEEVELGALRLTIQKFWNSALRIGDRGGFYRW